MDSHTRLFVHIIWATFSRTPILTQTIRRELDPYLKDRAQRLNCRILAIGGMPDHMHLLVRVHPATSVARLAQELKGASSHHINHLPPSTERLRWQGGYGAISCWERDIGVVVKYIETQRSRHASALWMPWRTLTASALAEEPILAEEWERAGEDDSPQGPVSHGVSSRSS